MPRRVTTAFNDSKLRAEKPTDVLRELRDGLQPGLIFMVHPSGRKRFAVRYVSQGKRRRLILGDYGPNALTLSKARERAAEELVKVRAGQDRAVELRAAKKRPTDTVEALATEYLDKHARKKKRTAAEDERVLNVYVLPRWRDRSVRSITRRDVRSLIEGIADRGAPIMANRVLEIVRKMFNFAMGRDWIDGNPASRIEKPGVERKRDRVLTDDEIRALWVLLERFPGTAQRQAPGRKRAAADAKGRPFCPLSPALAAVTKVRLLTAARGGEVSRMRWEDLAIDEKAKTGWWVIPAEHSKNGRPHRVPLVRDVVEIIQAQKPSADKSEDRKQNKPGDAKSSEFVFTGRQGALVEARVRKAGAALSRVLGFSFRGHDLRRTAATRMTAAGVPSAHVSQVLNHTPPGAVATRHYDIHNYDAEKRAALESWARTLNDILANRDKAKSVVQFRRGKA